jgi:quercetin dioxygenase-like cupin family protein
LTEKSTEINSLAEKVSNLSNMIDYQENSIVSRAIIDKEVGSVTLFAFDEYQGLSEHTAPFDALVYIFEGNAEFTVSGKSAKIKAGMITILPAGEPHSIKAISRFKMMLVMIRS